MIFAQTGTLLRRHRIPLPSPYDEQFYTVEHFNVGKEISFYSKVFKITGCDEFTHNFLRKLGVRVNSSSNIPTDPYTDHREKVNYITLIIASTTIIQLTKHSSNTCRKICCNIFGYKVEHHYTAKQYLLKVT